MFDFFSKFLFRRPKNGQSPAKPAALAAAEVASLQLAESKKSQVEQARAATLAKIETLAGNETALVDLLLACDFADGRFKAAQQIHSLAALEKVRAAMLNVDKRVVKLVQGRLEVITQSGKQEQLARLCIEEAEHLASQSHVLANQVTDLDKRRAAVTFPEKLLPQFEQLRLSIEEKLLAQTALQRRVLDILARLNQVAQSQVAEADAEPDAAFEENLSAWQKEMDLCLTQAEATSLPKGIVAEVTKKLQQQQQRWKLIQQEQQKREQKIQQEQERLALRNKPHAPTAVDDDAEVAASVVDAAATEVDEPAKESAKEAGESVTAADMADTSLSTSLPVDPAMAAIPREKRDRNEKHVSSLSLAQIVTAIDAMAEALAQGSIQGARKCDRELRGVDGKTAGLTTAQKEKLFETRSELVYLQGWAKWGGDVSRDELIKVVEELPTLSLAPNELAKKIAALRERWKEMEVSSGSAGKDIWERFDAACHVAYEPAALYFQQQAEQRKLNLVTAEATIVQLRDSVTELLQEQPDWKKISNFCMNAQQGWKKLGHVDRKHKARLDTEFETTLQLLQQPLDQRRKEEILSREGLIIEVSALDPMQRNTTDQLRALQERWQAQAASVPLRRKDEQILWDKYRAACDALFAQRKQASGDADAQRKENLSAKVALCVQLEQALAGSDVAISQLLQQVGNSWKNTAAVPRAEEAAIEQRYQDAVTALKMQEQIHNDQQKHVSRELCFKKLALCQKMEALLALDGAEQAGSESLLSIGKAWIALDETDVVLQAKLNAALQARFQAAMTALENNDRSYAASLETNNAEFDEVLLHLEILSGIDSPAELSRERLQMQVGVLQNTLKNGSADMVNRESVYRLLTLPVLLDPVRTGRLEKVLSASTVL